MPNNRNKYPFHSSSLSHTPSNYLKDTAYFSTARTAPLTPRLPFKVHASPLKTACIYLVDSVSIRSLKENEKEQDPNVNISQEVIDDWINWKF